MPENMENNNELVEELNNTSVEEVSSNAVVEPEKTGFKSMLEEAGIFIGLVIIIWLVSKLLDFIVDGVKKIWKKFKDSRDAKKKAKQQTAPAQSGPVANVQADVKATESNQEQTTEQAQQ